MAIVFLALLFLLNVSNDVPLLEEGKAATVRKQTPTPQEIKVVSYNIRWRSGEDLKKTGDGFSPPVPIISYFLLKGLFVLIKSREAFYFL